MELNELKSAVDFALSHGCTGEEEVLITLSNPSVGARAASKVVSANSGFDWEHGQFRIEPVDRLRAEGSALKDPRETRLAVYIYENRKSVVHHCPNCGNVVKKTHKYCPHCGQRITLGKKILFTRDCRVKRED